MADSTSTQAIKSQDRNRKIEQAYVKVLKWISSSTISFVLGCAIALLTSYLTGTNASNRLVSIGGCVVSAVFCWRLLLFRREVDKYYEKYLLDPNQANTTAWIKASNHSEPRRAHWYFGYLFICLISSGLVVTLLVKDNIFNPKEEANANVSLQRLNSIDSSLRIQKDTLKSTYQKLLNAEKVQQQIWLLIDSMTKTQTKAMKKNNMFTRTVRPQLPQ